MTTTETSPSTRAAPDLAGFQHVGLTVRDIDAEGIAWGEDLKARAILVFGHPLGHKDTATTVRVRNGETLLSDGPFAETKEFIGGISVISCDSRAQAIEIAAAHPLARHHMVEVRPFVSE